MAKRIHHSCIVEPLERRELLSTYYVSTAGSDSAAGSSAAPWRTLQRAADRVAAGDTVLVRPGTYTGFSLSTDGTAGQRIVFAAETPGSVIVDRGTHWLHAINMEGADYVTIEGFRVELPDAVQANYGIRSVNNTGVIIRNNVVKSATWSGILTGFSDNLLIENNVTSHTRNEHGIYVGNSSKNPVVRGNTSFANRKSGIQLNGGLEDGGDGIISNALVENNVVYGNGIGPGGSGLNFDSLQDSVIRNNLLYDNYRSGISLYSSYGVPSKNNFVANNTVVMPADGAGYWPLNIKSASTGNTVLNNVFYHYGQRGAIDISPDSLAGFVSDYNAVVGKFSVGDDNYAPGLTLAQWRGQTGQDAHSFVATPAQLFANAGAKDFRLKAGSPAADAGNASLSGRAAPATDLAGEPRPQGSGWDVGAYEYVSTPGGSDTVAPTISSRSPGPGAAAVSHSANVNVVFSEAVDPSSIWFVLRDSAGSSVPAVMSYDSTSRTAALDPSSDLAASATFTVTLSGARDAAGNVMTPASWSFTTAARTPPPTPATVFSPVQYFGDAENYTPLTPSRWQVMPDGGDTRLALSTTNFSGLSGNRLGEYQLVDGLSYADFDFTLRARSAEDLVANNAADYALVFGYVDVNNYSYLLMNSTAAWTTFHTVVNGVRQDLAPVASRPGIPDGGYHDVRLSRRGNTVTAALDGVTLLTATNDAFARAGGVGVGSFNDAALFDNINVAVPTVTDTTAPTAAASANSVSTGGGPSHTVTITYGDNVALDVSSFDSSDVLVTGPGGFSQLASFVSVNASGNGSPRTVTYRVNAPGGSWDAADNGTYNVLMQSGQVRDTSGNAVAGGTLASFAVSVPRATTSYSFWNNSTVPAVASANDPGAVELGMKFRANVDGYVTGVRFYKGAANTGTHTGSLWSRNGTLLARVTFTNETASGWQQADFSTPVQITAGTTYVVSYFAPRGGYAYNQRYFANGSYASGPITALGSGVDGGNGVYRYSTTGGFPTSSYLSSNYWVDVVFSPASASSSQPAAASLSPASVSNPAPALSPVRRTGSKLFNGGTSVLGGSTPVLV